MNTHISRNIVRVVAAPAVAAGILGGTLGMSAVANASTHMAPLPQVQSGLFDNTRGHQPTSHAKADPHVVAKITNIQEAKS